MRALTLRQRITAVAATVSLAVACAVTAAAPPAAADGAVSVSVDAAQQLAVIPSTGVGVNEAVYDPNMNSATIPGLLSAAGMGAVRYPGGSVQWGFQATWSSSDADPSAFWFNGSACAIG